jgi:hypothetical protein
MTHLFRSLEGAGNSVNPGRIWAFPRWSAGVPPTSYSSSIEKLMAHNSGLMQGKRGVILGVANNRSIAWGIEVYHVDSGYHVVGMKRPDAPEISLSDSLSGKE